ncbi:20173_t:CDS:1, partial [Cetraspora pellucida]
YLSSKVLARLNPSHWYPFPRSSLYSSTIKDPCYLFAQNFQ